MRLIYGDMFYPSTYTDEIGKTLVVRPNALCITVNGFLKKDGLSVLGRGCAKQAADKWPWLASAWGKLLKQNAGVSVLGEVHSEHLPSVDILSFPVKDKTEECAEDKSNVVAHMKRQFEPGDDVPGWACKARLDLIKKSVDELIKVVDVYEYKTVILPRPGVGAGELSWVDVSPILRALDDRFLIITTKR